MSKALTTNSDGDVLSVERKEIAEEFIDRLNEQLPSCYDEIELHKVSESQDFPNRLRVRVKEPDACIGYQKGLRVTKEMDVDLYDVHTHGSGRFTFILKL